MLPFSATHRKVASLYVVEFFNSKDPNTPFFRYETQDYDLATRICTKSMWLYYKWVGVRVEQTAPSGWPTFSVTADASNYPTSTGGHAAIYMEIENAYL